MGHSGPLERSIRDTPLQSGRLRGLRHCQICCAFGRGLPEDDVKIVIVRNVLPDEDHAEVAVRVDGRWLILDNRTLTLVRDTDVTRAIPKYVLDHKGLVDSSGVAGIVRRLARHEREGIPRVDPGGRVLPVLISLNPLSTLHRRFVCARLSQPYLPGSSVRTFPQRSPRWLLTAVA
jgi:hypothetical protein